MEGNPFRVFNNMRGSPSQCGLFLFVLFLLIFDLFTVSVTNTFGTIIILPYTALSVLFRTFDGVLLEPIHHLLLFLTIILQIVLKCNPAFMGGGAALALLEDFMLIDPMPRLVEVGSHSRIALHAFKLTGGRARGRPGSRS